MTEGWDSAQHSMTEAQDGAQDDGRPDGDDDRAQDLNYHYNI